MTMAEVMAMKEADFMELAKNDIEWLKKAAKRKEDRKSYPRVKATNKKGKVVYVADKSQEPRISKSPISFMSLKKAYCVEVLKLEAAPAKTPTFRDRIAKL